MLQSKLLFLIFLIFFSSLVVGQDNCSEVLTKAQDTYKEGRINEVAELLEPCLANGLNKQEKIEAYRLLTLTYLYFNEKEKAEGAMTELLHNDPEYKLRHVDPTEFVNLYNSFRTTPIVLIGAKGGVNYTDVDVHKNFSLDDSSVPRGKYKSNVGIQASLFAHFPISKKASVLAELLYVASSYTYTDKMFNYASLEFPEKQTHIGIPLLFNYNFGKSTKWVPYANIGASVSYLVQSKVTPVRVDATEGNNQREVTEGSISISSLRKSINYNLVIGGGLKVKDILGRGYIVLDVRYAHGLNNVVKAKERYSNNTLVYKYFYIDNDFKLNSFQYSLGYLYPLYKPKLKKVKKEK